MSVEVTTLKSGINVVTDTMPHLETASLGVWVNSGSRDERRDEHGISHLLEHMAFKGTRRRTAPRGDYAHDPGIRADQPERSVVGTTHPRADPARIVEGGRRRDGQGRTRRVISRHRPCSGRRPLGAIPPFP